MNSALFLIIAAAWVAIIGTAIAGILQVESAGRISERRGVLGRFLDAMIDSRRRKAQQVIDRHLARSGPRPADRKPEMPDKQADDPPHPVSRFETWSTTAATRAAHADRLLGLVSASRGRRTGIDDTRRI